MFPRLTRGSQRLHHKPCWIVGIFDGQLLLCRTSGQQLRQVDGLHTCLMLGKRNGLSDIFTVRENGQVVLFSIREAFANSNNLANQQGVILLGLIAEGDANCLFRFGRECLLLLEDGIVGLRVYKHQFSLTADSMVRGVEDTGRNLGLVTHADKAGHVGLNHHILLSHSFCTNIAIQHIRRVRNAHETPSRQTFRQRKLQHHLSVLVGL